MPRERATDGTFETSVSDEDILFFFRTGERPFYAATEIAAEFDFSDTHARRRLQSLSEAGRLNEIDVSDRHTVWWLDRDLVSVRPENDGYSAHDTTTGVASGGDTRAAAVRNVAEAIEAHEKSGDGSVESIEQDAGDSDSLPF